jgi:adenylate kinase
MNLVLLGSPGAGKGTQAERLAACTGWVHVATGDLFRANVKAGTALGNTAQEYMSRGALVPDAVTIQMLLARLAEPDTAGGVIFDGFPRNLVQARALDAALSDSGSRVDRVILIEVSDDEAVARLSNRWVCRDCGNIVSLPANSQVRQCERCGGQLYQRDDDKPDVVRARLESMKPPADMVDYYKEQGKFATVNGEQSLEAVTRDLLAALEIASGDRNKV